MSPARELDPPSGPPPPSPPMPPPLPFETIKVSGGLLISQELAEDIASKQFESMFRRLMTPETDEQRAARIRERNRLPNRLRRARFEVRYRITTAIDVLLDRHYCGDD